MVTVVSRPSRRTTGLMTEGARWNGYDWGMIKNQEKSEKLLLELTAIPTAAGHEGRVQAFLDGWLARRSKSLQWKRDRAGNLLIRRRNPSRKAPILITAHLDHPGFLVKSIMDREITLEFRGGVQDPYFKDAKIEIFDRNDVSHRARITALDKDAKPFKTVTARLSRKSADLAPGDIGRWAFPAPEIKGGRLKTNACDDLAAAAAALVAFDGIRKRKGCEHVGLLFTVAEEVGFVGAIEVAKNALSNRGGLITKSARLICLENSRSFPESPIGGGPIVRVGDRISVFSPELTNTISQICQEATKKDPEFKWQRKLMPGGACEATAFATYGFQSTCLCLPLGNYHNMADIDGVAAGVRPARVAREEIALADFHGMVRMLELVASRLEEDQGKVRTLLDGLHRDRRFVLEG
jgi:putative aminopeptidase FrvX